MEEVIGKPVSTHAKQIIQKRMAEAVTQTEGVYFYFYDYIKSLRAEVGEEILKKTYGDKYPEIVAYLNIIGGKIGFIKGELDAIKTGKLDVNDISSPRVREYRRLNSEICAEMNLARIWKTLLDASQIKNFSTPNDYFKESRRKKEQQFGADDKD